MTTTQNALPLSETMTVRLICGAKRAVGEFVPTVTVNVNDVDVWVFQNPALRFRTYDQAMNDAYKSAKFQATTLGLTCLVVNGAQRFWFTKGREG
jgi:hypothetical protein